MLARIGALGAVSATSSIVFPSAPPPAAPTRYYALGRAAPRTPTPPPMRLLPPKPAAILPRVVAFSEPARAAALPLPPRPAIVIPRAEAEPAKEVPSAAVAAAVAAAPMRNLPPALFNDREPAREPSLDRAPSREPDSSFSPPPMREPLPIAPPRSEPSPPPGGALQRDAGPSAPSSSSGGVPLLVVGGAVLAAAAAVFFLTRSPSAPRRRRSFSAAP